MSNGFNLKRCSSVTVAVRLVVVSIIFFIATPAVQANLISKPINTFVQVSHSTELSCRTDLTESITWMQKKLTDGRAHVLYTTHVLYDYKGRKNSDRMNVTPGSVQGGWYNLTIKNVSYNDAGVYTCVDDDNVEGAERHTVELVIIDASGLQCVHNLDICGHYPPVNMVNITCSLRYHGNTSPILLWKKNGVVINDTISFQFENATMVPSFTGLSLAMRPGQLISSMLSCELVDGTNYLQSAASQAFIQSLAFLFEKYGDTACLLLNQDNCTMEPTNQQCSRSSYYWPNPDNALMFNVNVQEINERNGPRDQVYYCPEGRIACGSEIHHITTTMSYNDIGVTQTPHATTVTAIVIPILLALVSIIITVTLLVRRKRKRRETPAEEHADQSIINCMSKPFFDQSSSLEVYAVHGGNLVAGLAVVGEELFVVRLASFLQVEAYHSHNFPTTKPTLLFNRRKTYPLVTDSKTFYARGLAACPRYKCLYVIGKNGAQTFMIHRVALSDNNSVHIWEVVGEGGECKGVSVTNDFNVLVTKERQISEYTSHGQLIKEVSIDSSIGKICHCVSQSNGNFVICQSMWHRVALLNSNIFIAYGGTPGSGDNQLSEIFIAAYGGTPGSGNNQLSCPCHLSVDKYDNVFVADRSNHRIVLLSPTLQHRCYIQTSIPGLDCPNVLHFDENNCRLYIGQEDGTIFAVDQVEDKDGKSVRDCTSKSFSQPTKVIPGKGQVYGVAVVDSQLFVVRYISTIVVSYISTMLSQIEVYNTNSYASTTCLTTKDTDFNEITSSSGFLALTACSYCKCLYVSYRCANVNDNKSVVYAVALSENSTKWNVDVAGDCTGLSVTKYYTLLVSLKGGVKEYATDGRFIREISLCDIWPLHVVQLSDGNFVVSHSRRTMTIIEIRDTSKEMDTRKEILHSTGELVTEVNGRYLAVDSNDHIFVAANNTVLLFSSKLALLGKIQRRELSSPISLHLDEANRQLYIGQDNGTVVVVRIGPKVEN